MWQNRGHQMPAEPLQQIEQAMAVSAEYVITTGNTS